MENSKTIESILNLTTLATLKDLNFVQGNDSVIYTADGTKLTVRTDTNPTEYQKDDGSIIFASDIISSHYHLDKSDENLQKIYQTFKLNYDSFSQRLADAEMKRKAESEKAEQLRIQIETLQREQESHRLEEEQNQREIDDIQLLIQQEQDKFQAELAKHLKNKQVYPAKERIELNDAATKLLFSLSEGFYKKMLTGVGVLLTERSKSKKKPEIESAFNLLNHEGYFNQVPPGEYDRAVLSYLCSEFLKGNRYVTFQMIQRGISGKVGKTSVEHKLNKNQAVAIENSLAKLMFTIYQPQASTNDAYKKLNYGEINITKSAILPACIVRSIINGKPVDAVYLDRISPLFHSADLKNQILRYPADLLDVPNQNNTPLVISIKNYCVRRVVECKQHKLTPTLTLDDIFDKCRIKNATKLVKQRAREAIDKLFAHLQSKGFIHSYKWRKNGGKFDAVTFTF